MDGGEVRDGQQSAQAPSLEGFPALRESQVDGVVRAMARTSTFQ